MFWNSKIAYLHHSRTLPYTIYPTPFFRQKKRERIWWHMSRYVARWVWPPEAFSTPPVSLSRRAENCRGTKMCGKQFRMTGSIIVVSDSQCWLRPYWLVGNRSLEVTSCPGSSIVTIWCWFEDHLTTKGVDSASPPDKSSSSRINCYFPDTNPLDSNLST